VVKNIFALNLLKVKIILLAHNLKNMKPLKYMILIIFLLFAFPASAFTAEVNNQGTIIINVYDENNKPYIGNWYLYQGTTNSGQLVRNGSSGEKFSFPAGVYFLEVLKKEIRYPYHMIRSDNPQTLIAGQTITYYAQYFQTSEQMANPPALSGPSAPAETSGTSESSVSPDTSSTDTEATDTSAGSASPAEPTGTIYSRTYMGPRVTMEDVTGGSAPTSSGSGGLSSQPLQLAQTGSPAFLLLIFSSLIGGIAIARKK